jgi:hypothetical protein
MVEVAMVSATADQSAAMLFRTAAHSFRWSLPNPPVFESLSWADLPVMIQQIDHPSFSYKSKPTTGRQHTTTTRNQRQQTPKTSCPLAPAVDAKNVDAAQPRQSPATRYKKETTMKVLRASPQSFTTFGWGDFPVCSDSTTTTHHSTKVAAKHRIQAKKQLERPVTQHCYQRTPSPSTVATTTKNELSPCQVTASASTRTVTGSKTFAEESPASSSARHIHFSQVHIREHSVRLGDHPLCYSYPMSLDWSHGEDQTVTIDEYEARRRSIRPRAGSSSSTISRMDVLERRSMLAESMGVTLGQMDTLEQERLQGTRGNVELLHRTESSRGWSADQFSNAR